MTDQWPFPGTECQPGFPKALPWEVFVMNDGGEWEIFDAFETKAEAREVGRSLRQDGCRVSVEAIKP